jgi:hypothetical protein
MRASLLFYRKLRKGFEKYGLKVKPYDTCVANMITKSGKQLTVVWHVDDLMGSCEDDFKLCRMPPSYVPYKGTYVPYEGTFGAPDQGQTLDV